MTRLARRLLPSRVGVGNFLIAACGAVALGVVPSIMEQLSWGLRSFLLVFAVAVAAVLTGWNLRRPRGVGIVLALYPDPQQDRWDALRNASRQAHDSTLDIGPRLLRRGGADLQRDERLDLVTTLIGARLAEHRASSDSAPVSLYPLVNVADAFRLGRRLRRLTFDSLDVRHVSFHDGSRVLPGVVLAGHLTQPVPPERAGALLTDTSSRPVPHPDCPAEHRHRLAVIVRLASGPFMINDARTVARTGVAERPDGTHTGYLPDDPAPCGAHVVIEATPGALPEGREAFETIAARVHQQWTRAAGAWSEKTGRTTSAVLFLSAPAPIAMALGWLSNLIPVQVVDHDVRLINRRRES